MQTGLSTKSANFRWIVGAGIGFVEIFGVDIYVGRDLKLWGLAPLQQSDLSSAYMNFYKTTSKIYMRVDHGISPYGHT